ncbi:unnamed protein product [Phytophthora fragariaefolia]|uniref:Unnamed protein product n=1 Tax=Phytophthora fragariaefolia TaxID=1490495 RepID=A0A9W6XXG5_9STRA|nr:unnamed protein product [Phytophthora fragariaefolia]
MFGVGAAWRQRFTSLRPSRSKVDHDTDTCEEDSFASEHDTDTGSEWLYIEEPAGFFVPKMQMRMQHLQLDQVHHVLHYGNFKHVMRLHNIKLVTPVEETSARGTKKWWMTVQDPTTLQVWVIHFPSRCRQQAWVDLLTSVFNATSSDAVVSDLVFIDSL